MGKADFGYKKVDKEKKQSLVQDVFTKVASKYDIMNDVMSFGLHRLWKERLISEIRPQPTDILLDVAGGTGDISKKFVSKGGGKAVICDLNPSMLQSGYDKAIDSNFEYKEKLYWVCANAEALPFDDNSFDYYTISFGIRNVTNIDKALKEAYRVLRPGGKFACLEFSNVNNKTISKIYDLYSLQIIPQIGQVITGSKDSYQYLVESIRKFPKAQIFANMIEEAGFISVNFQKLTFGVVAIHTGYKL